MAGNKKRVKKYNGNTRPASGVNMLSLLERSGHVKKVKDVTKYLNRALGAFYIVGDQYHDPMTFGMDELLNNLSGDALTEGVRQYVDYLFGQNRTWQLEVFHFLDFDGIIECIPMKGEFSEMTLGIMGDIVDVFVKETKDSIFESPEYTGKEDCYKHYGYYLNWGDDIEFSHMEPLIIDAFFKVSRDLSLLKESISVNGKKIIDSITIKPIDVVGCDVTKLDTDYIEVNDTLIKELAA